ncbi:MAG: sulfotransferase [Paracoccus sp. (in: a-proteobacteria)]|nr:sulfotransferase [Paracoccus sp. (in: a-proteobacteria)]
MGDRLEKGKTAAAYIPPPVIFYGALRSGTTMLRLVMNMNPALSCPGETDFLFDHLRQADDGWRLDRDALAQDRIFNARRIPMPDNPHGRQAVAELIAALGAEKPQGRLILVLHRGLERALEFLPDSPIVHIVRDPRDVAPSSVRMGWAGDVYHAVTHWKNTEQDWDNLAPQLAGRNVLEFRFEDFTADPEHWSARLCRFMGVAYDPQMMRFHETSTYQPIDSRLSSQWRRGSDPAEIALIESAVGPLIAARGYPASDIAPVRLTPARLLRVKLGGKIRRMKFRIDRYGLTDTVLDTLSNRLRLPSLGQGARGRMQQVDIRYLK